MPEQPTQPAVFGAPEGSEPNGGAPEGGTPDGRYATRRRLSARAQMWCAVAAISVVVLAIAWVTMGPSANTIRGKDVGFSVTSPESITITFDVAKPRDATVVCRLEALNANYAQVGTKDVTIAPADIDEGRYTTEIATTELAVTAVVDGCSEVD